MTHASYFKKWKDINLFVQEWMPESRANTCIGIIHGQSDHSSRFEHVARFFNENGYAVMALDLIGHGMSEGKRGHVDRFEDYVAQLDVLMDAIRDKGYESIVLYGHSMGGSIALQHALTSENKAAAYIVTSPLLKLAFDPPAWRVTLGRVMLKIWPGLVQPASLDSTLISHVEEEQQKYAKDPLVHGKITPAAFFGFMDAGSNNMEQAASLTVPVLALHGSGDKITSHKATRKWAESNPEQITYHELSGLYHEIHNELERDELFQLELDWLQKTIH